MSEVPAAPSINRPRHVKYWLRCLKTLLPTGYTSNDLNRITLGFFCVAALDLLGELPKVTTEAERSQWADWVYTNQIENGGFRGSPATYLGTHTTEESKAWDPLNLSASFFATVLLVTLGDDLSRLKKRELLAFLPKLQRQDGSFGEWLHGPSGEIVGGRDMRHMYIAAAVRWLLRGRDGQAANGVEDFDVDRAVEFIKSAQGYDYGFAGERFGEGHAGMTYCALGALTLLGRRDTAGIGADGLVRWLVSRQVPFQHSDGLSADEKDELLEESPHEAEAILHGVDVDASGRPLWGGFAGRSNKVPDTCYSFWVGASLEMLRKIHLMDVSANRRFLLEKTQHIVGGFTKLAEKGGAPDILHSFLGLAALALLREEGLNSIDPALCISTQAKERLVDMEWWKSDATDAN